MAREPSSVRSKIPANLNHELNMIEAKNAVSSPADDFKLALTDKEHRRFWSKVNKNGDCWEWTSSTKKKFYGQFWFRGAMRLSHRIAYASEIGIIPEGLGVCHACDNPRCVRPSHLWLGDNADNTRDMCMKNRQAVGERSTSKLHPEVLIRGERHHFSKLKNSDVISMRSQYALGGISQRDLAKTFGVNCGTVCRILTRERWNHV